MSVLTLDAEIFGSWGGVENLKKIFHLDSFCPSASARLLLMKNKKTLDSQPDTLAPDLLPRGKSRRNGKVARLPKKLRDLVNNLLSDGATYPQIIERLKQSTDPALPFPIYEKNLSHWHKGGHQDWLRNQERLELVSSRIDFALDLAQSSHPEKLQEFALQLAALRICEFLSQLSLNDSQTREDVYLRLLSALPRISKESLNLAKFRHASRADVRELLSSPPLAPNPATNTRANPAAKTMEDLLDRQSRPNPPHTAPATQPAPEAPAPNPSSNVPSCPVPPITPPSQPPPPDTVGHPQTPKQMHESETEISPTNNSTWPHEPNEYL